METLSKLQDIKNELTRVMQENCTCFFTTSYISMDGFLCYPESLQYVTYRAMIFLDKMEQLDIIWNFSKNENFIPIQGLFLNIDNSCPLEITSFNEMECSMTDTVTNNIQNTTDVQTSNEEVPVTSTDGSGSSTEIEMNNTAAGSILFFDNTMITVAAGCVAFVLFLVGTITTFGCIIFYWKISSR